jgi:hypothetical protein
VAAREPAQAAAERVADDADVGRRAGQRGEAVLGGGAGDLGPERAGRDAGTTAGGVDRDALHARGLDEDRVLEGGERGGVVAGALGGDAQAGGAGELDDRHHVVDVLGQGHEGGTLVDGEVPRLPRLVPRRVARRGHRARQPRSKLLQVQARPTGHQHPFRSPSKVLELRSADGRVGRLPGHRG